jgi:hypothetical protein
MPESKRPGFIEAWLSDLQDDIRRYGKRKLVPWKLLACLISGCLAAAVVPADDFWGKPEVSVVFFTAVLTLNGLLLALSWGSFAKIYEIASEPRLARLLRRHGLLDSYVFHVDFIHFVQVAALSLSGLGLVFCVVGHLPHFIEAHVPLSLVRRLILTASLGSSVYALLNAAGAVRLLQDLVWYSAQLPPEHEEVGVTVHEGGRQ